MIWESSPTARDIAGPASGQLTYFFLNFYGCALCCFQVLHQCCVPQEVPPSSRQPGEQGVLQLLQLDLELVLALCEVCLQHQHPGEMRVIQETVGKLASITMFFILSPKR